MPLGHHLSDTTSRPDCSRPFPRKPLQSVTSWPHTKWGGSLASRTRYVLPSNRLLPSVIIVKFSFPGLVSEAPPAQTAPSNVISLARTVLLRVLYNAPASFRRP